ncbi:hypothetical protein Poli38472_008757 [Pythium oligandrum]|uniref:F-box domain-containing protein n=1 Tax=Pythium oligandrum TaxID=41045 RepID=A0A8K1C413_PYTOL|nr:hypothetical protein Poli38472_008757 [Pythium oligandrum]|eukprot:TMW56109.1 hypothetical protein Poli38472_008757 [Pythium oligandrum]
MSSSQVPAVVPSQSAASSSSYDANTDVLKRCLLEQGYMAKPTAYAPYRRQEENPLQEQAQQLQAKLQALRDVRDRLCFTPDPKPKDDSQDVEMDDPDTKSMRISTQMALATHVPSGWTTASGGVGALGGVELLLFGFLSAQELVTSSAVCRTWYVITRDDVFWEPFLFTPLEGYPLRSFLGVSSWKKSRLPAIQVYSIYRKLSRRLHVLDGRKDESPVQSPTAEPFLELLVRQRRGVGVQIEQELRDWRRRTRARRGQDGTNAANGTRDHAPATSQLSPSLQERSIHLVSKLGDDFSFDARSRVDRAREAEEARQVEPAPTRVFDTVLPGALDEWVTQNAIRAPDVGEVVAFPEGGLIVERPVLPGWADGNQLNQNIQATETNQAMTVDGFKRVRLSTWLASQRRVRSRVFKSFVRQMLLAFKALEDANYIHSDVSPGNIFVLYASSRANSDGDVTMEGPTETPKKAKKAKIPLFQLFCRRSVNTWLIEDNTPPQPETRNGGLPHHHAGFAPLITLLPNDIDDESEGEEDGGQPAHGARVRPLLPRLYLRREQPVENAAPAAGAGAAPAPVPMNLPQCMIHALLRILVDVWCVGRSHGTHGRPPLAYVFRHPVLFPNNLRSFIEYAEFLLARQQATAERLLAHVLFQTDQTRLPAGIVPASLLLPGSFSDATHYRTQMLVWYTQTHEQWSNIRPSADSLVSSSYAPRTRLGKLFFQDALTETRLPHHRFLGVIAPPTATSSWVHALATSQMLTLRYLDLSYVQLPTSVLVRDLHHLTQLTHLRLPRELLREENLEQFIAAMWCVGLLPRLQVMDACVKRAMDRLERVYITQLDMVSFLLEPPTHGRGVLHHTTSLLL